MGVVFGEYEGTVGEGSGSVSEGDVDGVDRCNTGWEGPRGARRNRIGGGVGFILSARRWIGKWKCEKQRTLSCIGLSLSWQ